MPGSLGGIAATGTPSESAARGNISKEDQIAIRKAFFKAFRPRGGTSLSNDEASNLAEMTHMWDLDQPNAYVQRLHSAWAKEPASFYGSDLDNISILSLTDLVNSTQKTTTDIQKLRQKLYKVALCKYIHTNRGENESIKAVLQRLYQDDTGRRGLAAKAYREGGALTELRPGGAIIALGIYNLRRYMQRSGECWSDKQAEALEGLLKTSSIYSFCLSLGPLVDPLISAVLRNVPDAPHDGTLNPKTRKRKRAQYKTCSRRISSKPVIYSFPIDLDQGGLLQGSLGNIDTVPAPSVDGMHFTVQQPGPPPYPELRNNIGLDFASIMAQLPLIPIPQHQGACPVGLNFALEMHDQPLLQIPQYQQENPHWPRLYFNNQAVANQAVAGASDAVQGQDQIHERSLVPPTERECGHLSSMWPR